MNLKRVLLEYFIIMVIAFVPIVILHKLDKDMEKLENFTCGEALGRHHGHYAPDDWRDEVMWYQCVFTGRQEWPEGFKERFDIQAKLDQDEKFTINKIRVLETIIKRKGQ